MKEMNDCQVLLLNFNKLVQRSLYEMLCRSGYKVEVVNSVDETLTLLDENTHHIVLLDLKEGDDLEYLGLIKEKSDKANLIAIVPYGSPELAINTVKNGAFDCLVRPVKDEKILSAIKCALTEVGFEYPKAPQKKKLISLKEFLGKKDIFHGMVGNGQRSKEIHSLIERISNSKTTVLIQGESGTGKRLIAHAIHNADKKRKNKPFIELSCGALPRDIIESELFGHAKGAFTGAIGDRKGRFELSHGGTILLDDIDSLPLDLQVKLLRVLQQKEFERVGDRRTIKVDVRVIATTNQDIKQAVTEKKFREDLYYRINVISISVPPLRKKKEDLPLLAEHFMNLYSKENHKEMEGMSGEVLQALIDYDWPGNIRELENIIERAIILDTDNVIDADDLPEIILSKGMALCGDEAACDDPETFEASLKSVLKEPEKIYILKILKEVGWNKKKAAKRLGVNRTTLYNKLRKYNIFSENKN